MARAKTTERAEARRRYRAQLAAEAEADAASADAEANTLEGGTATPNVLSSGRRTSGSTQGAPAPRPARVGLVQAFRIAARPADIPGDLRAFPMIARRTKSIWLPTVLIVGTGALFLVPELAANPIVRFAGVALLAPPPMIPAFLAGMLTQRGSWLAGGFAGLVSGLTVAVLITVTPATTSSTQGLDVQNIGFLILVGPLFGTAVGAFSGFYRRFLALSSPPRQQAGRKSSQGSKSASTRRR